MRGILESAMVCEVNQVPTKDGKVFPKLVVLEQGKQYPECRSVRFEPSDATRLQALVGQVHNIHVNAEEFNGKTGKYTVYTFIGIDKKVA